MSTGMAFFMAMVYVLAQFLSLIVEWQSEMSQSTYSAINGLMNPTAIVSDPINFVTGIWNIVTWNYSWMQGGWEWLKFIGFAFSFMFIWAFIQLLVYAIGNIFGKIFK